MIEPKPNSDSPREIIYLTQGFLQFSDTFLSVKKEEKANWESIKPSVISSLNDYENNNSDQKNLWN